MHWSLRKEKRNNDKLYKFNINNIEIKTTNKIKIGIEREETNVENSGENIEPKKIEEEH